MIKLKIQNLVKVITKNIIIRAFTYKKIIH